MRLLHSEECSECIRLRTELERADKRLGSAQRQIARLQSEQAGAWQMSPFSEQGEQCFGRWNETCRKGKAKEFNGDRANNTIARLEAGQRVEDIFWAIEGARALAAGECDWQPRNSTSATELAKVCESEATLLRYQDYANEAKLKREEGSRAARHIFLTRGDGTWDRKVGAFGDCPACDMPTAQLLPTGEFRCGNGCVPDDILAGLRRWWRETYPDQRSRRMALKDIATGQRLDAQREDAA